MPVDGLDVVPSDPPVDAPAAAPGRETGTVSSGSPGALLNVPSVAFVAPAPADRPESAPDAGSFSATSPDAVARQAPRSGAGAVPLTTVAKVADQEDAEGDTVSIEFQRDGAMSPLFTFSADGLPPDLTIDSVTGLISGTIDAGTAEASPYETIVWVTVAR